MNDKLKKILLILFIILTIIFSSIIIKNIKIRNTINTIKENYISQESTTLNTDKEYIKRLCNKKNRNAEEDFIIGYIYKQEIYYRTAYKKISYATNRFVKYYLYNLVAKDYIEHGNIKEAKIYTDNALKNIKLNKDDKSYLLIWQSLIFYIDSENGREYIVSKTEEYIDESKVDKNTYMLRRYISPILYLLGERQESINNLFQVIFMSDDDGDMFTKVKATIDLGAIFIDLQGYDWAEAVLNSAMESSKNIKNESDKISLQIYIYVQKCNIYYLTEKYDELKDTIEKIYDENGKIPNEKYNDFLILAKTYESIYMSKMHNFDEAEKLLIESKVLLEKDTDVLLSDKDVNVELANVELYWSSNEFDKAIKLCEKMLDKFRISRSFKNEMIILNKLKELYVITSNSKVEKLDEYLKAYNNSILTSIMESYLSNNLSEYNNVKNIKLRYRQIIINTIIILILIIITILIVIMYYRNKEKNKILKKDIEILNNQVKYQLNHYENIKTHQDEVRLIWHDMKNHINTISGLFNDNNYEELKLYLSNLDTYVSELNSDTITKNKVLDAILFTKKQICNSKNIDFNINLKLPENIGIEDIDICIIFGNLIDNAIEACDKIENNNIKKYIDIKGTIKNNKLYMKIENSKENEVNQKGNKFITSKKDKDNHGLGVNSVKNSLNKYNSEIKIQYDKEVFKVFIVIQRGS